MNFKINLVVALVFPGFVLQLACGPIPAPKPVSTPSQPTMRGVGALVHDVHGNKIVGAECRLQDTPGWQTATSNEADGYLLFAPVTAALRSTQVDCSAAGYEPFSEHRVLQSSGNEDVSALVLTSAHVDPSTFSLEQLAAIRGAMWTARLNLPFGPRPGQDSNILPMAFYGLYGPDDQARMLAHYHDELQYTHGVTGPVTGNDCYHGEYPCRQGIPTQEQWDAYLDELQVWWDRGVMPVYFAKPDGFETPDHAGDMDALDALYSQPRAQQLLRIVVYCGWEPSGTKYGWNNSTYVTCLQRGARVFPNALRLLHTVSDLDAPTGGNDDQTFPKGQGNVLSWRNVAPYIHGWLVQVGGYVDGKNPQPSPTFLSEFSKLWADLHSKFTNGAAGWPSTSAWSDGRPLRVYYAEGASYGDFWSNWPESVAIDLGNRAMQAGADGYLDSGSVPVPVRR